MYETVVRSTEFFDGLLRLDEDLAEESRQSGCSCGGVLQRYIGVSERTLRRWRRWWRQCVGSSRWLAAARGSFAAGVAGEALPASLLEAFSGLVEPAERVVAVLRWLAPLRGGAVANAVS